MHLKAAAAQDISCASACAIAFRAARVAKTAVHALERVHSACPGLCHGDIRLQNIMLVQEGEEGAATPAGAMCMVIDFGRACFERSKQEQRREVQQLALLVRGRRHALASSS